MSTRIQRLKELKQKQEEAHIVQIESAALIIRQSPSQMIDDSSLAHPEEPGIASADNLERDIESNNQVPHESPSLLGYQSGNKMSKMSKSLRYALLLCFRGSGNANARKGTSATGLYL